MVTAIDTRTETRTSKLVREPVIEVRGLRKSYAGVEAVRGIDLTIYDQEIYAFVGPNGAGKTTTVEILEGYRDRDAGDVSVLGCDPAHPTLDWRSRIGLVLQTCKMPPELTVRELTERYAGYYPNPRGVDETLELVGLTDKANVRTGRLSGGQQRRLDVALGLVGNPELLFLDEPTTGFDPSARHEAWEVLSGLRGLGTTILLTTHYMDEAEALADRVGVIVDGIIVAEGPPSDLDGRSNGPCEIRFRLPVQISLNELPEIPAGRVNAENGRVRIETVASIATLGALVDWARARNLELPDLVIERPSLEDVYLNLIRSGR
jgi:ABC-2 type transport system ATP-binding protein